MSKKFNNKKFKHKKSTKKSIKNKKSIKKSIKNKTKSRFGKYSKEIFERIEVLADVEGCWTKVESFINNSKIFESDIDTIKNSLKSVCSFVIFNNNNKTFGNIKNLDNDDIRDSFKLKDNCKLVFLGDSIDNGPNNLLILTFLKCLKEVNGENVVLILGNREINKLRLMNEVFNEKIDVLEFRTPFKTIWKKKFIEYLIKEGKLPKNDENDDEKIKKIKNIEILKLEFLLKDNFGAPDLIKNIILELTKSSPTSELQAYAQIQALFNKDENFENQGLLYYYYMNSELIHYDISSKSLFMHGGINEDNFLKNINNNYEKINKVIDWIDYSDIFIQNNINLLINNTQELSETDKENIEKLYQYVEPLYKKDGCVEEGNCEWDKVNTKSVIHSRPWSDTNQLKLPDNLQEIKEYGIKHLFVSHSPVGEIPIILREKDFIMVACDTTYNGGIMANISLNKEKDNEYYIEVKTKFNTDRKKLYFKPCDNDINSNRFKELTYNTKDEKIGTIHENIDIRPIVISKYDNDKYLCVSHKICGPVISPIYFLIDGNNL